MRFLRILLGYCIAIAGLLWVFHDISLRVALTSMRHANIPLVLAAVLLDTASYYVQGWRWQLLLLPLGHITRLKATQAVYMGLFTNELLPLRTGELVRVFTMARWLKTSVQGVLGSLFLERIMDGIWLVVCVSLAAWATTLPPGIVRGDKTLALILLVLIGVVLTAVTLIGLMRRYGLGRSRIVQKIKNRIGSESLQSVWKLFSYPSTLSQSFLLSFFVLLLQAIAFWLILLAYGLSASLWVGIVVFLIVHLGTLLPNAPANVGSYQFFTVLGLTFFGFNKTLAAGVSVAGFIVLTLPLLILGFLAFRSSGLSIEELRTHARERLLPFMIAPKGVRTALRSVLVCILLLALALVGWKVLWPRWFPPRPIAGNMPITQSNNKESQVLWQHIKDLPLIEVRATPSSKQTLILFISGDGGWGGTESNMSKDFTHYGLPVVGLNTARYFLHKQNPDDIARDVDRVLEFYGAAWHKTRYILIGYSFGADVLPFVYNRLPETTKQKVSTLALMGPEAAAQFQLNVGYFFSNEGQPVLPELVRIQGPALYCFYGKTETDSLCPKLTATHAILISRTGGHRVEKDYNGLLNPLVDTAK